jgi:phenylalanyl-tRNA synthetase beta chain
MKVPLGWLREYVEITIPLPKLIERLTMAGLEVAGARFLGLPAPESLPVKADAAGPVWPADKIVVGQVLNVERHPNADRLTLATVDYGAAQPKVVVTGAPNIKVGDKGQKVVVALAGSVLFDGHAAEKALRELKPSKIRGVPSDAMVCSEYELGISEEHEGIILLEDDAPVGKPLVDLMGDVVVEIDVLPNMARCLSMIGVAREVAALTGQRLKLPSAESLPISSKGEAASIAIEDPKLCARYSAVLLKGVHIGPSPGWMQRRLTYAGMRPISNVVDVTNYVMLEWGQPLHAFDYDALVRRARGKQPAISVRTARPGEVLTTLDGQKRELTADQLLIADQAGPIALAGVMGGADTEVSEKTTNALLESANFDFVSIRRTMKALNLPSEASIRFSKGIHPETVRPASERAASLFGQCAGGKVSGGLIDVYPAPVTPQVIDLEMRSVRRLLGMDFTTAEAERILKALEFSVEPAGPERLRVTTPPHRLDIEAGVADLVEELARIHGYDRLPAARLADELPDPSPDPLALEERIRDSLVNAGLQEVITYTLTTPESEARLRIEPGEYVQLLNPVSSERVVMRRSLLASVLEIAAANSHHSARIRLFEVGPVYLPRQGERLPDEPRRIALVLSGAREADFWGRPAGTKPDLVDFYDAKGVIECLVEDLHLTGVVYEPASASDLHPGRGARVLASGKPLGVFGQLHPQVVEAFGLPQGAPVLVGELDLEALATLVPDRFSYTPVPRYPAALRDVAVIVDEDVPGSRIEAEIRAGGGDLLAGVSLFDLYRGESIAADKKSLAYALSYQSSDRTLTDKEVDKAHKKIEDRLRHVLKAQIRGKD